MYNRATPAQLYAGLIGMLLVAAGITGMFYESEFTSDVVVRDSAFGILEVNGWHNLIHIVTGGLGLVALTLGAGAARVYALTLGVVYVVVGFVGIGFVLGEDDSIFSVVPVNTEDNVLHLLLGLLGMLAGAASPERGKPRLA